MKKEIKNFSCHCEHKRSNLTVLLVTSYQLLVTPFKGVIGHWSRLIAVLLVTSYSLLVTAFAANPASINLKVIVNPLLSVDIGTSTYGFENMVPNETKISTGAIPVTNDSNGLTEDLQINGSDSANWTAHASTNTTENNFNLRLLISTVSATAPSYGDFGASNTGLVSGSPVDMTNANFGWFSDGHGDNVPSGTTKYLWFRLITPFNISAGVDVEQSITVTVTAAYADTY